MESGNKHPNGKFTGRGRTWLRLLQTLAEGPGAGQANSGTKQPTSRVSEVAAEQERLKEELRKTFVPPCQKKIREAATAELAAIPFKS